MVPMYISVILFNLAPFWTSLLAFWINGEPIVKLEYVAMAICFLCIIGMTISKMYANDAEESVYSPSTFAFGVCMCVLKSWV